jgi:hypothetical protein
MSGENCEICGGPYPCSKHAGIEALLAQADYWEAIRVGDDVWTGLDRLRDWKRK